ncbi:MAG: WD40 repeat domain-containing protein [Armatimonadetes bacterium]|nr:WD40 repeat domain-containing protein [Armatimonadota bacterium]
MVVPKLSVGASLLFLATASFGAGSKLAFTWTQAGTSVCSAYSPDGIRMAHGGNNGIVELREAQTLRHTLTLVGHQDLIRTVNYSADGGSIISTAADFKLCTWDSATGLLTHIEALPSDPRCCAVAPNGSWIATGDAAGRRIVWSLPSFQRIYDSGPEGMSGILAIDVSPDSSTFVAVFGNGVAREFRSDGSFRREFASPTTLNSVSFSPDGSKILFSSADDLLREYSSSTGLLQRTFPPSVAGRDCATYSNDGQTILTSRTNLVTQVDEATGGLIRTISLPATVTHLEFAPDDARFSAVGGRGLWTYDVATGNPIANRFTSSISSVPLAISPKSKFVLTGRGVGGMNAWNSENGDQLPNVPISNGAVLSTAFEPAGHVLAAGGMDGITRLYDVSNWALVRNLNWAASCLSVAYSPDSSALACGYANNAFVVWNPTNGSVIRQLAGHTGAVQSVAFSRTGNKLASGSADATVKIWDATNGALLQTIPGNTGGVWCVSLTPNGERVAAACNDGVVREYQSSTGVLVQAFQASQQALFAVQYSNGGRELLVGGNDGKIALWDAASGQLLSGPYYVGIVRTIRSDQNDRIIAYSGDQGWGCVRIARSVASGP